MEQLDEFMRVAETAAALGMSVSGVRARLERGQKVGPRLWLVPRSEVERWQALGRQKSGSKSRRPAAESVDERRDS